MTKMMTDGDGDENEADDDKHNNSYHIVYTPALFWHDVPIVLTYIYTLRFQAHSAGNLGRNSHVHNKATALLWSYLQ